MLKNDTRALLLHLCTLDVSLMIFYVTENRLYFITKLENVFEQFDQISLENFSPPKWNKPVTKHLRVTPR